MIKPELTDESDVILIGGDATVVTKSGQTTYALGRFYSSIYVRALPALSFQCLSLISVKTRKSWPIMMVQMLPKPKVAKPEPADPIAKRGKGRPKGAKNKTHKKVVLNTEMTQLKPMLETLLATVSGTIKTIYFVYDGAFGNNAAVQMTTDVGLHLISKLRFDSALYFPWQGKYAGRGAPRKYGNKVNYHEISDEFLLSTEYEKDRFRQKPVESIKGLNMNNGQRMQHFH